MFDLNVTQLDFHLDSKQISDMLDFIKFQNYTTMHGTIYHLKNISHFNLFKKIDVENIVIFYGNNQLILQIYHNNKNNAFKLVLLLY